MVHLYFQDQENLKILALNDQHGHPLLSLQNYVVVFREQAQLRNQIQIHRTEKIWITMIISSI